MNAVVPLLVELSASVDAFGWAAKQPVIRGLSRLPETRAVVRAQLAALWLESPASRSTIFGTTEQVADALVAARRRK